MTLAMAAIHSVRVIFSRTSKIVFLTALVFFLNSLTTIHAMTITVNASSAVTTINNELFGQNYAVYDGTAQASDSNYAAYTAAVTAMGAYQMRYPGGGYTDMMNWSNITCQYTYMPSLQESITFATACGTRLQPCVNFSGISCGTTMTHTAAVSLAGAWVTYMNKTPAAMPTTFWEVGNEQFVSGEPGYVGDTTAGGTTYGNQYYDFYVAMKAIDSNIKVGAQIQYDHPDFTNGALAAIKAKGITMDYCISHCYPYYCANSGACETTTVDSQLVGSSVDLGLNAATSIKSMLSSHGFPTTVPLWMSEFRSTVDEEKAVEWVDSMFVAQFLLKMAENGWRGANIWDIKNGYNTTYLSDYGLLASGTNTYGGVSWTENKPHPSWYVYPFLSKVFGRNLVSCSSSAATVRSWASTTIGGDLTIFMVNNDFSNQQAATISLTGFSPSAAGTIWTLIGSGQTKGGATTPVQDLTSISINGTVNPAVSAVPGTGNALTTGASFAVTLPAGAMVMVKIPSSSSTPIPTYTRTGTPTVTATPGGSCITLLNGCNSASENGTWAGANASRGFVTSSPVTSMPSEGATCMAVTVTTGAAYNSAMFNLSGFTPTSLAGVSQIKVDIYVPSAMVTVQSWQSMNLLANAYSGTTTIWSGQISSTSPSLVAGFQTLTYNLNYPATITSAYTYLGLVFAYNAATATTGTIYVDNIRLIYPCGVPTATPTPIVCSAMLNNCESLTENGTWDGANATRSIVTSTTGAPTGFPTMGSACLKALASTWSQYNTGLFNLSGFSPADFYGTTRLSMDVYVDSTLLGTGYNQLLMFADSAPASLYFQGISSTSPTLVAGKNSVTFTIDYQPPGGGTVTLTSNNAISKLSFVYNTSATTGSGSFYVDNIQLLRDGCIATRTPTRTFTPSPTPTLTRTFTSTPTPTLTPTSANTSTFTSTATRTFTQTSTPTLTPTLTPTFTATPTATATRSYTVTSTPTPSPTFTATPTRTWTASPTFTATATGTSTSTRTNTSTSTATWTLSSTVTSTWTSTRTSTPTPTSTWTLTSTPSPTRTASPTLTGTATQTGTATATGIYTSTVTNTPTWTGTRTATSTWTATFTSTTTPTNTWTGTATSTGIYTNTVTNTPTRTWTRTSTPTSTATFTLSSTPTNTWTGTATQTGTPTTTGIYTRTVTNTPTWTGTRTSTPTSTSTFTSYSTATSTWTGTATQTGTSTATGIYTGTVTNTPTWTGTRTATPTSTPTFTNTVTSTWTGTATSTTTFSSTPTATPSRTSTATWTYTSTTTSTSTATRTYTPTITSTPTLTGTPTWSVTGTQPPTDTFTVTSTPTETFTVTSTSTMTFTRTSTWTSTATSTLTSTPTSTSTSTASFTVTPTWTMTSTMTSIDTRTATYTPIWTGTATPTSTFTRTATATTTATMTWTATPSWTASASSTSTASPSPTWTFTNTPTSTPTTTWTATATFTSTATKTETLTPTLTWTPSRTYTPTWTATETSTSSATATTTQTLTDSPTSSFTPTSQGDCGVPVVSAAYPNPVTTDVVKFTILSSCFQSGHWSVYSAAYRKIGEWEFRGEGKTVVGWFLKDGTGKRVAAGLYYAVFIPESGSRQVRTLVVLP